MWRKKIVSKKLRGQKADQRKMALKRIFRTLQEKIKRTEKEVAELKKKRKLFIIGKNGLNDRGKNSI